MDPRRAARLFALSRVAVGGLALAFPGLIGGGWVGRPVRRPGGRVLMRGFGARDVAMGLGLLAALSRDEGTVAWLAGSALADGADFAATLVEGDDLPATRLLALGTAAGGTVTGLVLARALSRA